MVEGKSGERTAKKTILSFNLDKENASNLYNLMNAFNSKDNNIVESLGDLMGIENLLLQKEIKRLKN